MSETFMATRRWEPLLTGALGLAAKNAINSIADKALKCEIQNYSAVALAELALLTAYLQFIEPELKWLTRTRECLNLAADRVYRDIRIGLWGGMAGIGWNIEHISKVFADIPLVDEAQTVDDPLIEVDHLILERLQSAPWVGHYDLISGLVGLGIYFLERLPRESALQGIHLVVDHLARMVRRSRGGLAWHTPPELLHPQTRSFYPDGRYDLGPAHGVTGAIYLLGELMAEGIEIDAATPLFVGVLQWLAAQQLGSARSVYPNFIDAGIDSRRDESALRWCYGDLGIGAVLNHIGRRLNKTDMIVSSTKALDRCIGRMGEKLTSYRLCHGTLGVAHIYNRQYQNAGVEVYKEAALEYYSRGLTMRLADVRASRPFAHPSEPATEDHLESSLLGGDLGVALILISAVARIEPRWDRRLLLSGPSAGGTEQNLAIATSMENDNAT